MVLLFPAMPFLFFNVIKASMTSIGDFLDKNIKNEELKVILSANYAYYGDDPYSISLLYFSVAQAGYIKGGGHFIKGGSQKLSDYLAQYIEKNGGQVLLGKKVEKILIENNKASGVQFCDAFNKKAESVTVYSDAVIANAAIPLIVDMLPPTHKHLLEDKIKNLEKSCSLLSLYLGFDIDLKKIGVKNYSTFLSGQDILSIKGIKKNSQGCWDNRNLIFVDYSQIDSGLAPAGKSVGAIAAVDYLTDWESLSPLEYKTKKEEVTQILLKRLEACYPGILEHLEYYETSTAKTIKRYTLNPGGTPYGYAQTVAQTGIKRMTAKSPIKNLYFASAWTFPGGGFTGAILSGFFSSTAMNKEIKWSETDKTLIKDTRVVKLIDKKNIAENTIELTFEKPENFDYRAGQYAVISLDKTKKMEIDLPLRSLSMVSHPDENSLRFAMRVSNSSFKKACQEMKIGEEVTIFGPEGHLALEPKEDPIVFLISGIGITPVMSLLKEMEKRKIKNKVFVFYSNRTVASTAYNEELKNIKIENYTYIPVTTSLTNTRIDSAFLKRHLGSMANYEYFLVGTGPFLNSMRDILAEEKVDLTKIKEDSFG
jgi:hypothetical protein